MSDRIILDTCVVSYLFKGDSRANFFSEHIRDHTCVISFVTLAELYRWPRQRNWGKPRTDEFLGFVHGHIVLPYHKRVCWFWAQLMDVPGRPMPSADAWVAASALAFKLPLATHNRRDFEHIVGLQLIAPSVSA